MAVTPRENRGGLGGLRDTLRYYYEGSSAEAHRFRYGLLSFDIATHGLHRRHVVPGARAISSSGSISRFGLVILADFCARLVISRNRLRDLLHPATWADVVAIVSFLAPVVGEGARLPAHPAHAPPPPHLPDHRPLRADSPLFRRHEEVILAVIHLSVFLFVMSAIVYETQHWSNPDIANYVDALYFTVTALTTTGFGDITLPGTTGRLISVAHHDFRGDAVPAPRPRAALAAQGALPLPDLRAAAARRRRGALQGLRDAAEHPRRGLHLTSGRHVAAVRPARLPVALHIARKDRLRRSAAPCPA